MVGFTASDCFIHDLTHELIIGKGRQVCNLYVLDSGSLILAFLNNQNNVACSAVVDNHTWHNRLGHPSMAKIDTLYENLSLNKTKKPESLHCDICPKARQKRVPFPSDSHISKNTFDMIHIDVWGPFSIITHERYKYFLTIVDDHSRATWIYLLKANLMF